MSHEAQDRGEEHNERSLRSAKPERQDKDSSMLSVCPHPVVSEWGVSTQQGRLEVAGTCSMARYYLPKQLNF